MCDFLMLFGAATDMIGLAKKKMYQSGSIDHIKAFKDKVGQPFLVDGEPFMNALQYSLPMDSAAL